MANQKFSVNTDAVILLTAKLERLNKVAFPSAIRSTLNDASFAMKQKNIAESANRNMTVRSKTVFKKFTGVKKATGFNINSMQSEVGFIPKDGDKGRKVLSGMEHNEVGGADDTGMMYMAKSRTSNSRDRLVRYKNRFKTSRIAKGTSSHRKSKKLANVQNMIASFKEGVPTLIETSKGKFLVKVKNISSSIHGDNKGKLDFELDFLMRSRKHFEAKAKATHFVKESAIKTSKQMDSFYKKNAEYHFGKVWK